MKEPTKKLYSRLLYSGIILLLILLMQPLEVFLFVKDIAVLFPVGWVGMEERDLLIFIQAVMLIFILPVYAFTFIFSWWYRAENEESTYDPHLVDHKVAEFIWWGVPLVMTVIVATIAGLKTFELDPYRPLVSDKKPLTIDVVALQWKWLFIYPEEKVASVNLMHIPVDRPVHFNITADAPMNAFWIPKLGGMIYAMPGMKSQLHLIANEEGTFRGSSANISGKGFAGMTFETKATDDKGYEAWIASVKRLGHGLDIPSYKKLAEPSENHPVELYYLKDEKLFHQILMKYMEPPKEGNNVW